MCGIIKIASGRGKVSVYERKVLSGSSMAAKVTVASVHEIVDLGALDPEHIVTPGIFVQRVVRVERSATGPAGFKTAA